LSKPAAGIESVVVEADRVEHVQHVELDLEALAARTDRKDLRADRSTRANVGP
jgi:hypothetical protein